MDRILKLESMYAGQMAGVSGVVNPFAKAQGWEPLRRGRHANCSVFGVVNGLNGVIDIEMVFDSWANAPDALAPEHPFTLWCSASQDRQVGRWFHPEELYWQCPLSELPEYVPGFLRAAWTMLIEMDASELTKDWPGPSEDPDLPPRFGPKRARKAG